MLFQNQHSHLVKKLTALSLFFILSLAVWLVVARLNKTVLRGHHGSITSLVFSSDDKILLSGALDGEIRMWDLEEMAELKVLRGHNDSVNAIALSPDRKTIASVSDDTTVKLWDVDGKRLKMSIENSGLRARSVAFCNAGKMLAVGATNGLINLFDVATGAEADTLDGHEDVVSSLDAVPGGKVLLSGSFDGTVVVWDVLRRRQFQVVSFSENVWGVKCSPDGKTMAILTSGGFVTILEIKTKKKIVQFSRYFFSTEMAFSIDNRLVATVGFDKTVDLWSTENWKHIWTFECSSEAGALAFSNDCKTLAVGLNNCSIELFSCSKFGD
ncbi:MAG: WD40 repeat domain-containing protein [Planctomycetes bacterium]|nr:WD40 repeat domain-containing protein [Planctomycetota bacterium]